MGMRINTNTDALNTLRQLNTSNRMYATSMQRLSSGKRINSAADDAAGYAISQKLLAQSNGLDRASSNAQDGISMVQTASGGLQTIQDMLQRLRQLAVQSANDTNSASDRTALQAEADQISQEITQIATTTQFNGKNLLDGSMGATSVSSSSSITGLANGAAATNVGTLTTGAYTFNIGTVGTAAATTGHGTVVASGTFGASVYLGDAANAIAANGTAAATAGTYTLNIAGSAGSAAISVTVGATSGDKYSDVLNKINAYTSQTGVTATLSTTGGSLGIVLTNAVAGTSQTITASGDDHLMKALGLVAGAAYVAGNDTVTAAGTNGTATLTNTTTSAVTPLTANGNLFSDPASGFRMDLSTASGLTTGSATFTVTNTGTTLQVGANAGQSLSVSIGDMRATALGVQGASSTQAINLSSSSSAATSALGVIDTAIAAVSSQAALLGATQNRLQNAISNLNIGSENLQSAYSSITNVDMAKESTSLATAQILNQSGIAMLAQANQSPQLVLKLLG